MADPDQLSKFCPRCGHPTEMTARYCPQCSHAFRTQFDPEENLEQTQFFVNKPRPASQQGPQAVPKLDPAPGPRVTKPGPGIPHPVVMTSLLVLVVLLLVVLILLVAARAHTSRTTPGRTNPAPALASNTPAAGEPLSIDDTRVSPATPPPWQSSESLPAQPAAPRASEAPILPSMQMTGGGAGVTPSQPITPSPRRSFAPDQTTGAYLRWLQSEETRRVGLQRQFATTERIWMEMFQGRGSTFMTPAGMNRLWSSFRTGSLRSRPPVPAECEYLDQAYRSLLDVEGGDVSVIADAAARGNAARLQSAVTSAVSNEAPYLNRAESALQQVLARRGAAGSFYIGNP